MAQNLSKTHADIMVFDVDKKACSEFPRVASDLQELAHNCQRIITMLPDDKQLGRVYGGPEGLIQNARRETIFVDCSTVSVDLTKKFHDDASTSGKLMLDAPVSGGTIGAKEGTLTFMIGGLKETFECVKPELSAMGQRFFFCGPKGMGQAAKACNNMLLGISMAGLAEALNLGEKLGLSPNILTQVINSSSGRCWSSEVYNPVPGICPKAPASRDYDGGFSCSLINKDLKLAIDASASAGYRPHLALSTMRYYESLLASDKNSSEKDFSVIYKYLKQTY